MRIREIEVISMFCPKCGCEYRQGFIKCSDCACDLVEAFDEHAFQMQLRQKRASSYIGKQLKRLSGFSKSKTCAKIAAISYRMLIVSLFLLSFFNYNAKLLLESGPGWEIPVGFVPIIYFSYYLMIFLAPLIVISFVAGFRVFRQQSLVSRILLILLIVIDGAVFDLGFMFDWTPIVSTNHLWAGLIVLIHILLVLYLVIQKRLLKRSS